MQSSHDKDDLLMTRPQRISTRSNFMSKLVTWLSYNAAVRKKQIGILFVAITLGLFAYWAIPASVQGYQNYKIAKVEQAKVQKVAEEAAKVEALRVANQKYIETLKQRWNTASILSPMTDAEIDGIIVFVEKSYEDAVKDLSKSYYSMEYISKEGKYDVVLDTTRREMGEIINELNQEHNKTLRFMNLFKNSVRTFQSALDAGNVQVLKSLNDQMLKDIDIYSNWHKWKVAGEFRKTDRVIERSKRHLENVESQEGLQQYLVSKKANIDRFEPFTVIAKSR